MLAAAVSNYGEHHLAELLNHPGTTHLPALNQLEVNPFNQRRRLVAYCKAARVPVCRCRRPHSTNPPA